MKIKRLRRIRDAQKMIQDNLNISLTYYHIKTLYEQGIIEGFRIGKTIYINYDDLIKHI